ncbi:MAG: tRNA lysidine(34) synthetase TilS [Xanthomonadales bacterium]|nr:tRNA lysidine(34) synthetase TilS [Xanthomonadales bacterium]
MSNRSLAFSAERLLQILRSFPSVNSYIVGFSGGADSTALLHALSKTQEQLDIPVSAVHINHGIHPDADHWQLQCESFCHQHSIKLTCLKIELKNRSGKGLEAEARHLRYEAISALLGAGDCLLTAHHADDQAETLLLNLMRGSGVDGLSAMPESRPLGDGFLQRPLLRFKNSVLRTYLHDNHIQWSEDPSNQFLNHDRNFVRHEVIPQLEQRWPDVCQRLLLTRDAMTDSRNLLEDLADEFITPNLAHPHVLRITPQCLAKPELFKLVIRRWLKQTDVAGIPAYKLDTFCKQVKGAGSDHKISVHWDGWILRWYVNQLWLHADTEILPCPAVKWPRGENSVDLGADAGQLILWAGNKAEQSHSNHPVGEFSVAGRINTKDTLFSQGGFHKSLKKLFQASNIPPWLRDSIPLCKLDGELVAMGDWCFNEQFASWLSQNHLSLKWCPKHPLLQFILKQQHPVIH